MSSSLAKTNNELIRRRRKKRIIKRSVIFAIFLIAVSVILCLKLDYFNISNVKIINNNIISSEEIAENAKVSVGENIFYANLMQIKTNVLSNPYIESAVVKRSLPSTIWISVKEREARFYGKVDNKFYIIDKNGIVLEERTDINNMNLTNLLGLDLENSELGKVFPGSDIIKLKLLSSISELIASNSSNIKIDSVDVKNSLAVKVNCQNITIKLGDGENLKEKMRKAFGIIEDNNLLTQKGYVDVSFEGNPVMYIEKQEDKK